jgi:hypothetical protein
MLDHRYEHRPDDELLVADDNSGAFVFDLNQAWPGQVELRAIWSKRIPHRYWHRDSLGYDGRLRPAYHHRVGVSGMPDSLVLRPGNTDGVCVSAVAPKYCDAGGEISQAPGGCAAFWNSRADKATMDFMVHDPTNAKKHCNVGFEALWRVIA